VEFGGEGVIVKKHLVFFVLCILLLSISVFGFFGTASENSFDNIGRSEGAKARKIDVQINEFATGSGTEEIAFGTGGGFDTSLNISLPKRSSVVSAKMDLEGSYSPNSARYDYYDSINNSAWQGELFNNSIVNSTSSYETNPFAQKEYDALKLNDSIVADHISTIVTKSDTYLYHMFKFKVTLPSPTKLRFFWYGKSYVSDSLGMTWNNLIEAYIYCPGNQTWVNFDTQQKTSTPS
jgi:hypothetical protein